MIYQDFTFSQEVILLRKINYYNLLFSLCKILSENTNFHSQQRRRYYHERLNLQFTAIQKRNIKRKASIDKDDLNVCIPLRAFCPIWKLECELSIFCSVADSMIIYHDSVVNNNVNDICNHTLCVNYIVLTMSLSW